MKNLNKRKAKIGKIIFLVVLVLIVLPIIAGIILFKHYYNLLDIQPKELNIEVSQEQESQDTLQDDSIALQPEQPEKEQLKIEQPKEEQPEDFFAGKEVSEEAFNIMLVGVDSREDNFEGRTDSMILIHVNPETKKIITTSFLRDMYVTIPGYGGDRLNAAYVLGDTGLLFDTISYNFGIEVEDYVTLNFWLAIDIIDDLGGIDIEITEEEIEIMNEYIAEHNRIKNKPEGTDYLSAEDAGMRHLNGNQALSYARIRYIGTDFARSSRQRQIISICIDKLKHMEIKEINALLEKYLPTIKTNLTEQDVISLLFISLSLSDYTKESYVIPMEETWEYSTIDGMSVIEVDCEKNGLAWYDIIIKE